ncbi:MAG: 5-formyltetrahydrofolate cyclo-ligase [Alphaproteobacteria bacterium]|nr:5-formyltetrahydrofolate cyclo-ligase [Alphaproteobacteria bacterium]
MSFSNLTARKQAARKELRRTRALASVEKIQASAAMCDLFRQEIKLPQSAVVATYVADDHEIDPAALSEILWDKGHRLCLPCCGLPQTRLTFRLYEKNMILQQSSWKLFEPPARAPLMEPDILLVPLLGFDRQGNRMGRGGGYYDLTLQALRRIKPVTAIGLAYSAQEVPTIPVEGHDQLLNAVLTERFYKTFALD